MNSKKKNFTPSLSSAIFGVIAAIFGLVWTFIVWKMNLNFLIPTGILIIAISAGNAFINITHLSATNKFNQYDIKNNATIDRSLENFLQQDTEDYDRMDQAFHSSENHQYILCPYCNRKLVSDAIYCCYCGREIKK